MLRSNLPVSLSMLLVLATSSAVQSSQYTNAIAASNPVGWWRLGENAGATTAVNSGSAGALLNGTYSAAKVTSPSLIPLDPNPSADFTPTAHVSGTGLNSVGGGNPFAANWSIEVWFQRDAVTQWAALFSNVVGVNGAPILTFNDNSSRLGINQAGVSAVESAFIDLGTAPGGYLGKTVYAVITKTGGNGINAATFNIYANVDGNWLTGPNTTGTNYWAIPQADGFYIGRHYNALLQTLDGRIDEVAIYNRALTLAEINAHFLAATVPEPSTFALLGLGGIGLAIKARRRRQAERSRLATTVPARGAAAR